MKIPFTPVIYEHAARFVGRSPWEVSRDPELMFAAHRAAYMEYHQQVIAVAIDIYNLEAEAYGAKVVASTSDAIPGIHEPLLSSIQEGIQLQPFDPARDGRISMMLSVGQRLQREFPDADVRLPVGGPFSIAFNLRGINDLCLDAALDPEGLAKMLMRLAENQAVLCRAVAKAGLDVAFFESAAAPPILSPHSSTNWRCPPCGACWKSRPMPSATRCRASWAATPIPVLDDILSTGTNYVACNVETNQAAFVERVSRTHPHVKIRVNLDPGVVACRDPQRIYRAIDRVLEIVGPRTNCVMGTGALPLETPPENIRLIREYLAT